ncbi:rhodanese-like domain-containing protein [Bacteroidota bacterium]
MNINFVLILKIILSSIVIALVYNFLSVNGLNIIKKETPIVSVQDDELNKDIHSVTPTEQIKGINLKQAFELFNSDRVIFIDARDQWDYNEGHIQNSINIPEFSFEPSDTTVRKLDKNNVHVVYCEGDDCEISKRLAINLISLGFSKTYVFTGGFYEWLNASYPVARSNDNESDNRQ